MATTPKKVKAPTEVALSAIQEALNISDGSAADNNRGSAPAHAAADMSPVMSFFGEHSLHTPPDRPTFNAVEETRAPRRAANDDRETIGQILQAIQKGRLARNSYTLAT